MKNLDNTPLEIAHNLFAQAMGLTQDFCEGADTIPDIDNLDAEGILGQAKMLRHIADLFEAAAVLKTVTALPTRCPECGCNLLKYVDR